MSLNLYNDYTRDIQQAYIITVNGNQKSEQLSKRCQDSCDKVGMKFTVWDAFDGTKEGDITPPDHLKDESFFRLLKITDHYLTRGEVACALSHISLWYECAKIDRPIVILEHDAIMLDKIKTFESFNSIVYLGGSEWVVQKWPMYSIPPLASDGPNKYFICRAHAYAIDPIMARNLLTHVLKYGICDPLDIMMRADLFNITHQGQFAYDRNDNPEINTTIKNRPKNGRTTERNDKLKW